jgi:hypothetical protein
MRAPLILTLLMAAAGVAPGGEFSIKPVEVTSADRAKAMRERPMISGAGIIWGGRSITYKMPDDFNRVMAERVREAGVTAARHGFNWAEIEEEPGEHKWELGEADLNRLLDLKLEVIGLINTTPGWASPSGESGTFEPSEEAAELFENFCRELARRYRGKIRYFQYGHSMDIDPGWMPKADPVAYARWLKRAYKALKEGNPDCVVGTGGHLGRSAGFLNKLYQEGGKDFFDAVGVNPWPAYEAPQGDEAFDWQRVEDYRVVMVKNGDEASPIWCSEFGVDASRVGPEKHGELMARALDYLVHYEFVTASIYWTMADYHRGVVGLFGLCDKDLQPRPSFEVWKKNVAPLRSGAASKPPPGSGE